MNDKTFNKWFNVFILAGMTLVMIITTIIKLQDAQDGQAMLIVAAFGSLMGVLSTVCSANAKILTFLFGFFDVAIYGVMCYMGGRYGNAALHMLYFLPMQFIGFFQWRKRGASSGEKPKARRLDAKKLLASGAAFLLGLLVTYFILLKLDEPEAASVVKVAILMDAFSTMCNILGQLLMSTAYMEQWYFWIGVNITSIIMWGITMKESGDNSFALIYMIKYAFYLLNSLNGLRIWLKLSKDSVKPADLDN